jgi:hypothetical protein
MATATCSSTGDEPIACLKEQPATHRDEWMAQPAAVVRALSAAA